MTDDKGFLVKLVSVTSLVLFAFSSLRHALFQSTALDLAFFDQLLYLLSQELPPISSIFGFHILGDHAAFILYPIALLYKIYPNVHWLFAVQAVALAVGAVPVYALSLQAGLSVAYARAIAISYVFYPALFNINFYTDYRPEAIAVPALLWAVWAGIANKPKQLILAITLVLSCKDILSLTIIALGFWLWLSERKRIYGWGCIAAGGVWFLFTICYLVPMLRGGQAGGVVFYGSIGSSFTEIAIKVITNPGLIIGRFLLPDRLFYYLLLILPVIIGLSWRQLINILPALPMLILNILSDYSAQRDLIHHYSLPIFPFLFLWSIRSRVQNNHQQTRKWLKPRFIVLWSMITFLALAKYDYFFSRYLTTLSNINSVRTAVSLVQTQGSLLTTSQIGPHLSHRPVIKVINENADLQLEKSSVFDYVLLDLQHLGRNISRDLAANLVEKIQDLPQFELTYQNDDVYLFRKKP